MLRAVTSASDDSGADAAGPDIEQVERLLDDLQSRGFLSDNRFAESLVHRKAAGFGTALLRRELRGHALEPELVEASTAELRNTEAARALALWQRRFGVAPADLRERARQQRFLLARGFDAGIVGRIVGGQSLDDI